MTEISAALGFAADGATLVEQDLEQCVCGGFYAGE